MSSLSTWLWGTSQLDDAVDKATSELLPSDAEDIALNLEICDQIRSKSVNAKDAMRALKRRLNHKNPNVQLLALGLTDICIKNGGDHFLVEVASREFMDNLVSILKIPVLNHDVKNKMLRLIQNWAVAFEGKVTLSYVGQVYKTLKSEGFNFPPEDMAVANAAMVDTQTAPEWIDSDVCLRCRTAFSFTNRKHHCRNCGLVFDQQCSSKTMPLPHFGITQDVRVCDACYAKLGKNRDKIHVHDPRVHRHSSHSSRHRSGRDLADAELQRAIQLSLEEAGFANPGSRRPGYVPYPPDAAPWQPSEPPVVDRTTYPVDRKEAPAPEEDDPDLRAAIEASLREANAPKPSAPPGLATPRAEQPPYTYGQANGQPYENAATPVPAVPKLPNYDLEPLESDVILTFSQTIDQVHSQGGRDMTRYPAVNELYDKANGLRPKLAMSLDDTDRKEQLLSEMHDKLSQAVKLYDQLLTRQVAHPPWRSPQAQAGPAQQPYQHQPQPQPQTPVYGQQQSQQQYAQQWSPSQQQHAPVATVIVPNGYAPEQNVQSPGPYQQPPSAVPQSPPSMYAAGPSSQYFAQQQPVAPQHTGQYAAPPPPPSGAPVLPQSWQPQAQQQQQPVPSQQPEQYSSPPSASAPAPPQSWQQQPPQAQQAAQQPSYAQSAPPNGHLPPAAQYQPMHQQPVQPSAPTYSPQSPPIPAQTPQFAVPSTPAFASSLGRHNTVKYAASPPPAQSQSFLSRSNTVAHAPTPQQYAQAPAPLVPQPQPQPEVQLPSFPVVPTSAPQTFNMYGPSIPTSPPAERKEVPLIDL